MMPPVLSWPSGTENGCIAKEGSQGLQTVSTAGISAQRWPGVIVPVGFGPHENWGLSLLVGERRVELGRCKVRAQIWMCFLLLGVFWGDGHQGWPIWGKLSVPWLALSGIRHSDSGLTNRTYSFLLKTKAGSQQHTWISQLWPTKFRLLYYNQVASARLELPLI